MCAKPGIESKVGPNNSALKRYFPPARHTEGAGLGLAGHTPSVRHTELSHNPVFAGTGAKGFR